VVKQLFCSKCHCFIANYTQDLEGTQLIKNGKPYGARCRSNTWVIDGKKLTGFFAQCPQGHINVIKDTPDMIAEAERLNYNYGKVCTTHYRALKGEKVICNVMQPCSTCQAYLDYLKLIGGKEHGINQ